MEALNAMLSLWKDDNLVANEEEEDVGEGKEDESDDDAGDVHRGLGDIEEVQHA